MQEQYYHEQPHLTEEEIIHIFLSYVVTELPSNRLNELIDPGDVFIGVNQDQFMTLTMHCMVSEGLITTEKSRHGRLSHFVRATPKGIRVAQSPGGYRSYAAVQRNTAAQELQIKLETDHLNREAAKATIDAAESARISAESARISTAVSQRSLRISKIAIVVPSLIALAALVAQVVSSNDAAVELAMAQKQIKELQGQVEILNSRRK